MLTLGFTGLGIHDFIAGLQIALMLVDCMSAIINKQINNYGLSEEGKQATQSPL